MEAQPLRGGAQGILGVPDAQRQMAVILVPHRGPLLQASEEPLQEATQALRLGSHG